MIGGITAELTVWSPFWRLSYNCSITLGHPVGNPANPCRARGYVWHACAKNEKLWATKRPVANTKNHRNGIPIVEDRPLLNIAETMYGGRRHAGVILPSHFISAIPENGLCSFLDILKEPGRTAAPVGRVKIITGRIEHLGRPYHQVQDAGDTEPPFCRYARLWIPMHSPRRSEDDRAMREQHSWSSSSRDLIKRTTFYTSLQNMGWTWITRSLVASAHRGRCRA